MNESSPLLKVGHVAPDFTLNDQENRPVNLYDELTRHWVVLFFYPKDRSPICTTQACAFRDAYEQFRYAGAELLGVSSDSTESHGQFVESYTLPYRLLSDPQEEARKGFRVPKTFGLIPGRATFVINPEHQIRMVYPSQFFAKAHMDKALQVLRKEGRR